MTNLFWILLSRILLYLLYLAAMNWYSFYYKNFSIFWMYFVYLLLHFVLAVFLHAADTTACASYEIEAVDGTGSRLIRPTSEVSDSVDVLLWFQEVWGINWEWLWVVRLQPLNQTSQRLCCPKRNYYYCFLTFLLDFL